MTIPQLFVTYAVSWWMVLFMVLPFGVKPEAQPGPGHAPSAPKDPNLKRKFKLTALLAVIPTVLIYLVATNAHAEETIYHAGGGCKGLEAYKPSDDLMATDGEGVGGKTVKSANLAGGFDSSAFDEVEIPLQIPTQKYTNTTMHNADLSHSFIETGKLKVSKNGDTMLNGKSLTATTTTGECHDAQ